MSSQKDRIKSLISRKSGATNYELSQIALCYSKRIQSLREELSGTEFEIPAPERVYRNNRATNTYVYRLQRKEKAVIPKRSSQSSILIDGHKRSGFLSFIPTNINRRFH